MEGLSITIMGLIGAAAGGFLGAAFGALAAFVFTGFAILAGIAILIGKSDPNFLNLIGLGPFFGPHISFASGVAAAAYASHRGWLSTGRDIVTPLVSLGKPSVLLVGACFGLFGYIIQALLASVKEIGANTDSIALTVVISAIVARLLFSRAGVVGQHSEGRTGLARFAPSTTHAWLPYQDSFAMTATVGLFVGLITSWATVELLHLYPTIPGVILLGFAISAVSCLFLGMQMMVPVTHHITLISAVAVSTFFGVVKDDVSLVLVGALSGMAAAVLGQLFSRFWLIRADTHIDPPASAIWPMTTALIFIAAYVHN